MRRQCGKRTKWRVSLARIAPPLNWSGWPEGGSFGSGPALSFRRGVSDESRTGAGKRVVPGRPLRPTVRARFPGPSSKREREEGMAIVEMTAASKATPIVLMCIIECRINCVSKNTIG